MPILSPAQPLRRRVRVLIHPARTNGRPFSRGSTCRRRNRTAFFYTPAALVGRIGRSRISIPTTRAAKKLLEEIRTRIDTGEINIGIKVVPKTFTKQAISLGGDMKLTTQEIFGRKIPFSQIQEKEIDRFHRAGIWSFYRPTLS